jgi:peroxiredoxin
MNRTLAVILVLCLIPITACNNKEQAEPTPEETNLVEVGQIAPDFTVKTLDGGTFRLSANRGKVVLVNWFATWCGPCIKEMPHLQKEVWERFRGEDFAMVSIAREETLQVVQPFVAKHKATWPFALDPEREAFASYAEAFIPRNYVIDRDGKVLFQSQGYEPEEFAEMVRVIAKALGGPTSGAIDPVETHLEAMGAAADRKKITSVTALAQATSPNGPYTTLLEMASGGRVYYRQSREAETEFEAVLNGAQGWLAHDPAALLGDDTWWMIRCHAFQWLALDPGDWFTDLREPENVTFGGRPCARWTGADPFGAANHLYFSKETDLLAGFEVPNSMGEGRVKIEFREWKTLGGVQLPSKVVATDNQGDFILDFTEITLNDAALAVFAP